MNPDYDSITVDEWSDDSSVQLGMRGGRIETVRIRQWQLAPNNLDSLGETIHRLYARVLDRFTEAVSQETATDPREQELHARIDRFVHRRLAQAPEVVDPLPVVHEVVERPGVRLHYARGSLLRVELDESAAWMQAFDLESSLLDAFGQAFALADPIAQPVEPPSLEELVCLTQRIDNLEKGIYRD